MKIEKINDNKIKCTLNPGDLEARKITIKEIATGSEKAHELLNEMMTEANAQFGFKNDGAPLMIEAACLPSGEVILLISKTTGDGVPEKGRGRYDFTITKGAEPLQADVATEIPPAEEVKAAINNFFDFAKKQVFNKIQEELPDGDVEARPLAPMMVYIFKNIEVAKSAASIVKKMFEGEISIYKNASSESIFIVLFRGDVSPENYNKVCNLMAEYGAQMKNECVSLQYYKEHYDEIYSGKAKGARFCIK